MNNKAQATRNPELKGWHVLVAVIGFFGLVFAVNGAFLFAALSTYSGVVSKQPYVKGLHYNNRIALDDRQARLGWSVTVAPLMADRPLQVEFRNRAGHGIERLEIAAVIGRPSTAEHDRTLTFKASTPGVYLADVHPLAPGSWLLSLKANRRSQLGDTETYRLKRRLWRKQ